MSLPVRMRCPRNTSATKLFGPPSFVLRSSSRNALFQTAHGLGKIIIAGRLALIVAAVFAGRGSLRQHRVSRLRSFRDYHGNLAPAADPPPDTVPSPSRGLTSNGSMSPRATWH